METTLQFAELTILEGKAFNNMTLHAYVSSRQRTLEKEEGLSEERRRSMIKTVEDLIDQREEVQEETAIKC